MTDHNDRASRSSGRRTDGNSTRRRPPVVTELPESAFPLSAAQLNIWFAQKLAPNVPFTVAQYVDIDGDVDVDALIAATDIACRRLESPGIRLVEVDGQPYQWMDWDVPYAMEYRDFRDESDPVAAAQAYMDACHREPVDMNLDQLIVSEIMRVGERRYFWYSRAHHVVMDGLGAISVQERTASVYSASLDGTEPPKTRALPVRKIFDYEAAYPGSSRYRTDREHWLSRLADIPETRRLSGTAVAPSQAAVTVGSTLDASLSDAMAEVARRYNSSDVALVLAAFAVYFGRMTDTEDVMLSLPVSGRTTTMLRESSGMMSNVVPLRVILSSDATVESLLQRVLVELTGALRHQRFRVEDMQRELDGGFAGSTAGGRGAFGPTVNIMMYDSEIRLGDVIGEYRILSSGPIDDLMVNIYPGVAGSSTRVDFLGNPLMYSEGELSAHHARFLTLLRSFVSAPENTPIANFAVTGADEAAQLLTISAGNPVRTTTLADLLPDVSAHGVAIDGPGGELTHRQVRGAAEHVARQLIDRGIGTEDRVAVALPRSTASVIALWGVALAGASSVPVDPRDPRTPAVIADSGAGVVIASTTTDLGVDLDTIVLDTVVDHTDEPLGVDDLVRPVRPDNEAYLIHTSGSTGKPKGVSVTHRGLAAMADFVAQKYRMTPTSRVLHLSSPVFDASVQEILGAAVAHSTLVVAPPDVQAGPALGEFIALQRITHLITAPSVLATLDPGDLACVEVFDVGGETCPPELVTRFTGPERIMLNAYGPTESTVLATVSDPMTPHEPVTIGSALPGTRTLVLDSRLRPVPPGGIGELYVGGAGIARGYRDAPATTSTRFVADPADPGARLYRTGDVVRVRADASGTLEHLGRTDFQVQINGRRVELGEVEAALRSHPDVRDAVVVHRGGRLIGYVVADATPTDVRVHLGLPAWMTPSVLIPLAELPLTPGGKVDRRALPSPEDDRVVAYVAPITASEEAVAEVFADVLGASGIGRDHNFFELGGDSLSATRVLARVNSSLGSAVTLPGLFEAPTVAALAALADRRRAGAEASIADTVLPEHVPLSYGQHRMWIVNQFDPTSPAYNLPTAVQLESDADPATVVAAVRDVVDRHAALRTYYPDLGHGPEQVVSPAESVVVDLPVTPVGDDLAEVLAATVTAGFDVAQHVPLRLRLLRRGDGRLIVVIVTHHIAADGWSVGPLTRDFGTAYAARTEHEAPTWDSTPVEYTKYAVWQRHRVDAVLDDEVAHWTATLNDFAEHASVPTDRPRPHTQSLRAGSIEAGIPAPLWSNTLQLALSRGVTPFMVVHAAVAVVLSRLGSDERVVLGTPVAGRGDADLDDVVGMFVGTVPLAVTVPPAATFETVLLSVRDADLTAVEHSAVPFERLVTALGRDGGIDRHPIFEVMLAFDNAPVAAQPIPDVTELAVDTGASEFDLALELTEAGGAVTGRLRYATDLYDAETAHQFLDLIQRVLRAAVTDPRCVVGDIEFREAPVTEVDAEASGTLADVLIGREGTALVTIDGDMSYAELDSRSTKLARVLISRGVGAEDVVALSLPRSADYIVALWAVVKSGAAFMPVDPSHPADRRRAMLWDVGIGIGSGYESTVEWIDPSTGRGLIDAPLLPDDRHVQMHPLHPAYVIYTSGSSGEPKPVTITHGAVAELARQMPQRYGVTDTSRVLHGYSPNFDAAVLETMLAFAAGAAMVIAPTDIVGGDDMAAFLTEYAVTHYLSTPAVLASIPPVPSVQTVAVGGDVLPPSLAHAWASDGRTMLNAYGPSESTVVATLTDPLTPDGPVTIGRALDGSAALVLDARLHPVVDGGAGELYLAGPMLARGYGRRAADTASRFVAGPGGVRMYRTGDRVRLRRDGALDYLGRSDFQVQLRGQRLELAEVEAALRRHPAVADAAAGLANGQLIAWVSRVQHAPNLDSPNFGSEDAVRWLATKLPSWAVPARVVVLDALPTTVNGKVDRRALVGALPAHVASRAAARTLGEDLIASVYADVLGLDTVGVTDTFFALGGDSLTATRAVSRIGDALGVSVPVRVLFENPTPRDLAAVAATLSGDVDPLPPVTHRAATGPTVLSPAERRMWLQSRIDPESGAHNVAFRVALPRDTDLTVLRRAMVDVVARHRPLRTVYPMGADGPAAVDTPADEAVPELTPRRVDDASLMLAVYDLASAGFDLPQQVPIRIAVFDAGGEQDLLLVVVVHHIAVDGSSIEPLTRDFAIAHAARSVRRAPEFPRLAIDYGDYRVWQDTVVAPRAARRLAFWTDTLRGLPDYLELPTGSPTEHGPSAPVQFRIDAHTRAELRRYAQSSGVTPFVLLHAALAILLAQLSGTSDIAIGTPVAGRTDAALDPLVGMFVGTVALRTAVNQSMSWADFVTYVRDRDLEAFDHQDVPFDDVVEALDPDRSANSHPLFQVLLAVQTISPPEVRLGEHTVVAEQIDADDVQFDLEFVLTDSDTGIDGALGFSRERFSETAVAGFAQQFVRILRTVVERPNIAIGNIDSSGPDTDAVVTSAEPVVAPVVLGDLLRSAASRNPQAQAVRGAERWLSYAELDILSDRMARTLAERGAGPGAMVAIALPRSLEYVITVWAVAKTGAGFMPVEPAYPTVRIAAMLIEVDPVIGVTDARGRARVEHLGTWLDCATVLAHEDSPAPIWDDTPALPTPRVDDVAYVVYTSGSTGTPKGVRVTHRGLANLVAAQKAMFHLDESSRVLQFASPSFDASVFEMLMAFGSGASLVVVPPGVYAGRELEQVLQTHDVTHVCLTPSVLQSTEPSGAPSVRVVVMAGEPTNTALIRTWASGRRLFDAYGPTETTVMATCSGELVVGDAATIGRPTVGVSALVLDARLRPVAHATAGELFLSGPQLADGYAGRTALTAERFVPNPFGTAGERMYRTGDLVRWTEGRGGESTLEYLGRADAQIKIRGHRVEPAEVEAALLRHPRVSQATVVGRGTNGSSALVAYVVGTSDEQDVREHLTRLLPSYLVPSSVTALERLPLTVSGKVDTNALPEPTPRAVSYRAPDTATERTVAAALAAVLAIETDDASVRVGLDDNFFELGGHSLGAVQVMDSLRESFGRPLPVIWLFTHPTPARLAQCIDSGDTVGTDAALGVVLPLRESGELAPLFCIHPAIGVAWSYAGLTSSVDPGRPVYGLQVPGLVDQEPRPQSIDDYARRYVTDIRRIQPSGPYHLLGWSIGGVIAHAIAAELQRAGERVESLVLLDPYLEVDADAPEFTMADLAEQLGVAGARGVDDIVERMHAQRNELSFLTAEHLGRMFAPVRDAAALVAGYTPTIVDTDVEFFAARGSRAAQQWVPYVSGDVTVHVMDVAHENLGTPAVLDRVGRIMEAAVDARASEQGVLS